MKNFIPDPISNPEIDFSGYSYIPLYINRLFRSKAWLRARRKPELGFYMINLWTRAWLEKPVASIEADDDILADAAQCSPERWDEIKKEVLQGWELCSDGRWYNRAISDMADEVWAIREKANVRAKKGAAARWGNDATGMPKQCLSNAQASPEHEKSMLDGCLGNADAMPEQCPGNAEAMLGDAKEKKRKEKKEKETKVSKTDGAFALAPGSDSLPLCPENAPPKRGTMLPDGWQPSDKLIIWAGLKTPLVDPIAETEVFVRHWISVPGPKAFKRNWDATWMNWMTREQAKKAEAKKRLEHIDRKMDARATSPRARDRQVLL